MTERQWWLYRAVTHIMLACLLTVWVLMGFGVCRWVRS